MTTKLSMLTQLGRVRSPGRSDRDGAGCGWTAEPRDKYLELVRGRR